jgi:hypothetical protein
MNRAKILPALALAAGLAAMTGAGARAADSSASAKKCKPNPNPICYQIYAPVTCSNGKTYTNQCYADADCATGCVAANPV